MGEDQFHTLQDVEDLTPDTIPSLFSLSPDQVELYIKRYNGSMPCGQHTEWCPQRNLYSGYVRVEMNLARPINVISGTRPPSIYNMMSEDTINDRTLTTFYLPPGTEKALHITSQTTTQVRSAGGGELLTYSLPGRCQSSTEEVQSCRQPSQVCPLREEYE